MGGGQGAGTSSSACSAPLTPAPCAGARGRVCCPLPLSPARVVPGGALAQVPSTAAAPAEVLSSQEASSPQPLSLSSQNFFTLDFLGDPTKVRNFGFLIMGLKS